MQAVMDQKSAFAERLARISSGQQFEHSDIPGKQTHQAYNRKYAAQNRKGRMAPRDKMMIGVALLSGALSVLAGKIGYAVATHMSGLPKAVYTLEGRGVFVLALMVAMALTAILHLSTKGRLQALVLGCLLAHFGVTAMAQANPALQAALTPATQQSQE